jgi:NADH-quinone oxidoreductase subunit G
VGNDASEQNPLVAWQIRTALRNSGARLYIVDSRDHKLRRKAKLYVEVPPGQEAAGVAGLTAADATNAPASFAAEIATLREALAGEGDLVVLFGAALQGGALSHLARLAEMRAAEGRRTRFMALGDFANSRGAADMGLLPDRLPGYVPVADVAAREAYGTLWGATLSAKPGLATRAMLDAALTGQIKALYVVGANPVKTFDLPNSGRPAKLELLIAQDLFLSETAQLADIVLPALSAYEKDGTMTNTAGEVQLVRKGGDVMGPRSDFDMLRILSHQLARHGVGHPIRLRTPEAAFDEIRRHVAGYGVSWASLLTGGAEPAAPVAAPNGHAAYDVPANSIFSAADSLFTSGSLSRYCRMIQSLREVEAQP